MSKIEKYRHMKNNNLFIGRQEELARLALLKEKKTASLVVVTGRRRIGKSRLINQFATNSPFLQFSGLPPTEKTSAQDQRNEFAKQLQRQGLPNVIAHDWSDLFALLTVKITTGFHIVLLDEISWMGDKDPNFLGKLKNIWDMEWSKNPKLIVILCGSVSSWIEKNILSSTGFLGRISEHIKLNPLSLKECNQLLEALGFRGSIYEKLMLLSVTGCIPWYIEQIHPKLSASDNIKRLCFTPQGILVQEFKKLFHDLFGRRNEIYRRIIETLVEKNLSLTKISETLHYERSGALSEYLTDLVDSYFIAKISPWSIKTGKISKISRYRLTDNYLRFYLKYIEPHIDKIEQNLFKNQAITSMTGWDAMLGLQFENLVVNNALSMFAILKINPLEVVMAGPFYQRKTVKQKGCQIDYLIQTKFKTLYLIEVKFSRNPIESAIIEEIKEKIARLVLPKGYACLPVLIHVNGVTSAVEACDYFYKIIDLNQLL